METFEINLVGEVLTVQPLDNDTFEIYRDEKLLATLTPTIDDHTGGTIWETADLIAPDYAKQIGELIEEHEM